jgi:hypothetical protein
VDVKLTMANFSKCLSTLRCSKPWRTELAITAVAVVQALVQALVLVLVLVLVGLLVHATLKMTRTLLLWKSGLSQPK